MSWIDLVEYLARGILLILAILSVWSVGIILERRRFFKNLEIPGPEIKKKIKERNFDADEFQSFSDFFKELSFLKSSGQIDRAFDAYVTEKKLEFEKGLPILGTLGSTTPFVGLLGTILGIIVSFGELSKGVGNSNTVMYSLAEALVLTAAGLVVAIPAVVAFNYFSKKSKMILSEVQKLKDLYLAYKE